MSRCFFVYLKTAVQKADDLHPEGTGRAEVCREGAERVFRSADVLGQLVASTPRCADQAQHLTPEIETHASHLPADAGLFLKNPTC